MRIRFSKQSTACFISHLDLVRCMSRAFNRADISLQYTNGYNPRPYIVFAAPLSLGICSNAELMDVKIINQINNDDILKKLSNALPTDIKIIEIYESKNQFKEIDQASYKLRLPLQYYELFSNFTASDHINIIKKSKKGQIITDIKSDLNILSCDIKKEYFYTNIMLPCGSNYNVSAMSFLNSFFETFNPSERIYDIERYNFINTSGKIFK